MPRKPRRQRSKARGARGCASLPCTVEPAGHQVGSSDPRRDKQRHALLPGKRISRSGRVYYEYRRNRSDLTPDEIPARKRSRKRKR